MNYAPTGLGLALLRVPPLYWPRDNGAGQREILRYKGKITRKRPGAVSVRPAGPIRSKSDAFRPAASGFLPVGFAALFVLFLIAATLAGALPRAVAGIYAGLSVVTFLAYRSDKLAARDGRWRTKESTLLLLGLVGGWPGAVLAQKVIRHKSRKRSFQVAFWGTVVINVIALAWWLLEN